jgi:endopeptidase La
MVDIINIKLKILQNKYKYLCDSILNFEKHVDYLHVNYYIEFADKNNILILLFNIMKKINIQYNNYIINNLEKKDKLYAMITEYLPILNNIQNTDYMFEKLVELLIHFPDILPLYNEELELKSIISNYGYTNIIDALKILNYFELTNKQKELINEINNIFIVTKIEYKQVDIIESNNSINKECYWIKLQNFKETDLLELSRELLIRNKDNNYYKISGFFINDAISCVIKTSQINYKIIDNIKNNFIKKLGKNNKNKICLEFVKKFIRYDYLGNIYCLDEIEYENYVSDNYKLFLEITNDSFINIMKNFISNNLDIKLVFNIIFLLLLGTSDNEDIASLLLGLIKEKKQNSYIYNLICQRVPYYFLVKIKIKNNIIKSEIDKLKSLTLDDVDYKKQLLLNKHINNNVKSLTLEKINEMKNVNNEYYKQLTFVKNILKYPWVDSDTTFSNISSDPKKSLEYLTVVEKKLHDLSYGHKEAKNGLLQIIGKWISNPSSQGTSFGFVGPPGVGKTLLAKSISKALDIPFAEITLGGQNDGEILHGHGYTYSGSQPGLIVKKMVEMGKARCILYFDELDKTCSKHGTINEITSILIHLTDQNMNKSFQDRFFQGIDFPLDKVIMIFSYNDSSLVDPILLDRLKQIEIKSYTLYDKMKIVKDFIIKEIATSIGLNNCSWINMSDDIIEYIINNYTNEAGVRSIKRKIEQIFLSLNLDKIYKRNTFKNNNNNNILITKEIINDILDKPIVEYNLIHTEPMVGIINGLYATSNGDGGIIPIQIYENIFSNKDNFEIKFTGTQGTVMKESIHCALTCAINYIKHNYPDINIDKFKHGFHIHCPSTSTPKDGPSAGCAFTIAFISRMLNKPINNTIGLTGEIDLTGKITKIGGLNFKLIGAKKAGIKLVFIPKENETDLIEIKKKYIDLIDNNFSVEICDNFNDIINKMLC